MLYVARSIMHFDLPKTTQDAVRRDGKAPFFRPSPSPGALGKTLPPNPIAHDIDTETEGRLEAQVAELPNVGGVPSTSTTVTFRVESESESESGGRVLRRA